MGIAYLNNGLRMPIEEYEKTEAWRAFKKRRHQFDNYQCAFCHKPISDSDPLHHLDYTRAGHERIEDCISVCRECHDWFHSNWDQHRNKQWEGSQDNHWVDFDLMHTAQLCNKYLSEDYFFGGDYNLCSHDCIRQFIDKYHEDLDLQYSVPISSWDVQLFFRNMRYEDFLTAINTGETVDSYLNRKFGTKNKRGAGRNINRENAYKFVTKHDPKRMAEIYEEAEDIIVLIDEVNRLNEERNGTYDGYRLDKTS